MKRSVLLLPILCLAATAMLCRGASDRYAPGTTLVGQQALDADWRDDIPGLSFLIRLRDLPGPYADPSANNGPQVGDRPDGVLPRAPAGFVVEKVIDGLGTPRKLITAPNGDIFIAETGAGRIRIVRQRGSAPPDINTVFAERLPAPFGLAFYPNGQSPRYLYVANTNTVVRFPYHNGDLKATEPPTVLIRNLSNGGGGHSTRDIVFSPDNSKMFVSVGSASNVEDRSELVDVESRRARIYEYNPNGSSESVYAYGIRNPVGLAVDPATGLLWTSVNERDGLGDNLVPDYVTHVERGEFFGWPWFWMGGHEDRRAKGAHKETAADVSTPDVLLQPHLASLCMTFYRKGQFPSEYNGDAFACEHGSWNRSRRVGYKVIRIRMNHGRATGVYTDFLTNFVLDNSTVWGRPVGVTEGVDGSLYVTDDGSNTLWHVRYTGNHAE